MVKVDELAAAIRHIDPACQRRLSAIAASLTAQEAIAACKRADVVFSCVDNDAARLAAAITTAFHHKVLIDVATGIRFRQTPENRLRQRDPLELQRQPFQTRELGADVRLILPGDGCLLCRGNLSNYAAAVEDLCNHRPLAHDPDQWRQERAGSLRSLNQVAVGLAMRMFEDLVAGRLTRSTWAHLEFDLEGRLAVTYPPTSRVPNCPLCARAGAGDQSFSRSHP